MQVDESDQDHTKGQKLVPGTDMELEGLVMEAEFDHLQRYSDRSFLVQGKQDTDSYFVKNFFKERSCQEGLVTVRCTSISSRGGSVFNSRKSTFFPQIWSHPWIGVGFSDRMGLE